MDLVTNRRWLLLLTVVCFGVFQADLQGQETDPADVADSAEEPKELLDGSLIRIPLPITGEIDTLLKRQIDQQIQRLPVEQEGSDRPVLILEFDNAAGATGQGSEFERCSSLARYLVSKKLARVRTVAYIPASSAPLQGDDALESAVTVLQGHAVLVAMACEQIVMDQGTAIGGAMIDESNVDEFFVSGYRSIAQKREIFPNEVVESLIDPTKELHLVFTETGTRFANADQLGKPGERDTKELDTDPAKYPVLKSDFLQQYKLIRKEIKSRNSLAETLRVRSEVLKGNPFLLGDAEPLYIKLEGEIESREIEWILNALEKQLGERDINLIFVEIESTGGSAIDALRLAERLADFDPLKTRTVAYVPSEARSVSSLIAMACDDLIVGKEAIIGGVALRDFDSVTDDETLDSMRPAVKLLAESKGRNWSLLMGLVDSSLKVRRMQNRTGTVQFLCPAELEAKETPEDWNDLGPVELKDGLNSSVALSYRLAEVSDTFDEVRTSYHVEEMPPTLTPTAKDRWVADLARNLSSPLMASMLLFGAMFFLSAELSHPGIGVAGLLSVICITLFFWSNYLDGNADLLEIMLFVVGMALILIEIFILPGFGVFGLGGGVMMIASIILASQDFVIPRDPSEMRQLPISIGMLGCGLVGSITSFLVLPRVLPYIPYFNKVLLEPPGSEPDEFAAAERSRRESLVQYDYLIGKRGSTLTPLLPSGKAQIGDEVINVISDGRMIEKGETIVVDEVHGSRVVVRPLNL